MNRWLIYGLVASVLVIALAATLLVFLNSSTQPKQTNKLLSSTQSGPISEDNAVALAMPYINQYATENGRTITNVTATLYENFNRSSRPGWEIYASFDRNSTDDLQRWTIGYQVVVMADTGEIALKQEYGIY